MLYQFLCQQFLLLYILNIEMFSITLFHYVRNIGMVSPSPHGLFPSVPSLTPLVRYLMI